MDCNWYGSCGHSKQVCYLIYIYVQVCKYWHIYVSIMIEFRQIFCMAHWNEGWKNDWSWNNATESYLPTETDPTKIFSWRELKQFETNSGWILISNLLHVNCKIFNEIRIVSEKYLTGVIIVIIILIKYIPNVKHFRKNKLWKFRKRLNL